MPYCLHTRLTYPNLAVLVRMAQTWQHEFGVMPIRKIGKDDLNDSVTLVQALHEGYLPCLSHFHVSFPATASI